MLSTLPQRLHGRNQDNLIISAASGDDFPGRGRKKRDLPSLF
jgi:hypothetical protein